jgi:hypothetical protein
MRYSATIVTMNKPFLQRDFPHLIKDRCYSVTFKSLYHQTIDGKDVSKWTERRSRKQRNLTKDIPSPPGFRAGILKTRYLRADFPGVWLISEPYVGWCNFVWTNKGQWSRPVPGLNTLKGFREPKGSINSVQYLRFYSHAFLWELLNRPSLGLDLSSAYGLGIYFSPNGFIIYGNMRDQWRHSVLMERHAIDKLASEMMCQGMTYRLRLILTARGPSRHTTLQ